MSQNRMANEDKAASPLEPILNSKYRIFLNTAKYLLLRCTTIRTLCQGLTDLCLILKLSRRSVNGSPLLTRYLALQLFKRSGSMLAPGLRLQHTKLSSC